MPVVAAGDVRCARCNEVIGPGEEWQLDHRDDGRGWLGPSHKRCNLSAGWEKMVASVAGRNGGVRLVVDEPCRWSRRWHEDPPVGTEVKLKGGLVEVYVGRGVWQIG